MAMKPESVVHKEIADGLLRIGWENGNEKLGIEEHRLLTNVEKLTLLGDVIIWDVLERKIRELNRSFFVNLTDEEEEKVWEEIKLKLESSDEVELLEALKYGLHVTALGKYDRIKLIDYENPDNNEFFFLHEAKYPGSPDNIKPDFSLFINGIPIVIIEAKAQGIIELDEIDWRRWAHVHGTEEEALTQIRKYEEYSPKLFRFVQFAVAYGDKQVYTPTMPGRHYAPAFEWRYPNEDVSDIFDLLTPERLLDVLRYFTFFFKRNEKGAKRIKVITRWNQYRATKRAIERIAGYLSGNDEKSNGLIWQWQGSGKTFIMFFIANWFLNNYKDRNPVVFFIVDRNDLEEQHSGVFQSVEDREFLEHFDVIEKINELRTRIEEMIKAEDTGRVIPTGLYIAKIQKFQYSKFKDMVKVRKVKGEERFEAEKAVRKREVLFLVDEAHRTQYGRLASVMRALFPKAMFFGFTGTPIFKRSRNTFYEFAYPKEGEYFLDVYFIKDSIRDGFTLDITHAIVEEEDVRLKIDENRLRAFMEAYENNDPEDFEAFLLGKRKTLRMTSKELLEELRKSRVFLESPKEIERFAEYIAKRIYDDTMGFQFKVMVVAVNRKACVHFKKALDKAFKNYFCSKIEELENEGRHEVAKHFRELCENAERLSEVVMTYPYNEDDEDIIEFKRWLKTRREFQNKSYNEMNKVIVDWFREEEYPKVLIVTDMLLTGFDEPKLRVMYLYKPIFEHRLLQAVTRVNRPYPGKETGLVVDAVGLWNAVIRVKGIYEMLAEQDPRVLKDFERNFARSIEEKVKEFEDKLSDIKEELSVIGIEVELIKALRKQGRWEELEREIKRVRETLAPIALAFKGNDPQAVRLLNDLREVVSLYRSLGAHPARLAYFEDMMAVGAVYSTFIRLIGFTGKKSRFWDELLRFVHENMEVGPMREILKIKLGELSGTGSSFDTVARFYKLYYRAEDNSHDPVYKAILERLNKLLEQWLNRNIDLKTLAKEIKALESQADEYDKKRTERGWKESLVESVRFYLAKYMGLENVELKRFQRELKRLKRFTKGTSKKLSGALIQDIMSSIEADDNETYRRISREIDRLMEDSIIPAVRRYAGGRS